MELISYDLSRVILLTQVHRAAGQIYLPEAAAMLIQRYSFVKYPGVDDLQKDTVIFNVGKFRDVQISELAIYNDGLIVSGRCDTDLLRAFTDDLFDWLGSELGIRRITSLRSEWHYESALLVKSTTDIAAALSPNKAVRHLITSALDKHTAVQFQPTGSMFDCDPEAVRFRRKPARFSIERRLGVPYSENLFYCQSPLPTEAHLAILAGLEGLSV